MKFRPSSGASETDRDVMRSVGTYHCFRRIREINMFVHIHLTNRLRVRLTPTKMLPAPISLIRRKQCWVPTLLVSSLSAREAPLNLNLTYFSAVMSWIDMFVQFRFHNHLRASPTPKKMKPTPKSLLRGNQT